MLPKGKSAQTAESWRFPHFFGPSYRAAKTMSKNNKHKNSCQSHFCPPENQVSLASLQSLERFPSKSASALVSPGLQADAVESLSDHTEKTQKSPSIEHSTLENPPKTASSHGKSTNSGAVNPGCKRCRPPGSPPDSGLVHNMEISTPKNGEKRYGRKESVSQFLRKKQGEWPFSEDERKERDVFLKHGVGKEWYKLHRCGKDTVPFNCDLCGLSTWAPIFCGVRICVNCYWNKFGKKFVQRRKIMYTRLMAEKGPNGADRVMFLTLTTINVGRLPGNIKLKKMINRAVQFCREHYKGWDLTLEIKHTETGPFLHIHAVVYGGYIPHAKLCKDWGALNKERSLHTWIEEVRGVKRAVNYLSWYLKKAVPLDDSELKAKYLKGVKGLRRVRTGGVFYGMERAIKIENDSWDFSVCPRCGEYLSVDHERFSIGQTVDEARIRGDPSYGEALRIWNAEAQEFINRARSAGSWPQESIENISQFFRLLIKTNSKYRGMVKKAGGDLKQYHVFNGSPIHEDEIPWDADFEDKRDRIFAQVNEKLKRHSVIWVRAEIADLKRRIEALKNTSSHVSPVSPL